MTRAAALQNAKYPRDGEIPSRTAPAAPGKPTRERVCPANVCRLRTMNHPMAPETTATMVPARKAFTMNGYENSCRMLVMRPASSRVVPVAVEGRRLGRAHDHQAAIGGAQDLDGSAVQGA